MLRITPTFLLISISFLPQPGRGVQGSSSFDSFLAHYNKAKSNIDQQTLLDNFWSVTTNGGTPVIDTNGRNVVFLFRGDADSVFLAGDMTQWRSRIRMTRLKPGNLFYVRQRYESDARLDYKFVLNQGEYVLDPLNKRTVTGGFGENSELRMPGYFATDDYITRDSIPLGRVLPLLHPSTILGYSHDILVYFPFGYFSDTTHYPVVYFQDGSDYLDLANALVVLDNLIADGAIRPTIGVFIVPPRDSLANRETEYGMNDDYVRYLCDELVPTIDSNYRTLATSDNRLILGASYGGLIALHAAFSRPEIISNAASQSGYVSFQNDSLIRCFSDFPTRPIALYLDVGTYEKKTIGAENDEGNLIEAHRRFAPLLETKHYKYVYRELHGGHSWGNWRNELPRILQLFFRPLTSP